MKISKALKIALYLLLFFLIGGGIFWFPQIKKRTNLLQLQAIDYYKERFGKKVTSQISKELTTLVTVERAKLQEVEDMVTTFGNVSRSVLNVHVEQPGRISFLVDKSKIDIKKGEIILKLNEEEFLQREKSLSSLVDFYKKDLDKKRQAAAAGAIAMSELERSESEYQRSFAELELVKISLKRCTITAPFNCKVKHFDFCVEAFVNPHQEILQLYQSDKAFVQAKVGLQESEKLYPGQRCVVTYEKQHFEGKISYVSPAAEKYTAALDFEIELQDSSLPVGAIVNASVHLNSFRKCVLVPKTAIIYEGPLSFVFIVQGKNAFRIPVQISFSQQDVVGIEGISEGQLVVVEGAMKLSNFCEVSY